MKKLFVLPVLVLGILCAQVTIAQEMSSTNATEIEAQDDYIEVAIENLPQAVLDAVAKDFAGAVITTAAAKDDASEYKLTLTKEDGESMEVYCDAEGNWITKD